MSSLPPLYRYIASGVYVGLAVCTLPFYILVIKTFFTHKVYRRNVSFAIMAVLGIFDCIMLLGFIGCGVFTAYDRTFHWLLEKALLSVMNASRNSTYPTILLLAFNRFVVLTRITRLFAKFYRNCVLGITAYWLLYCILGLTPFAGMSYFLDFALGAYDQRLPWNPTIGRLEYYVNLFCLLATFLLYLGTVAILIVNRRTVHFEARHLSLSPEVRVLIQAVIIFTVYALDLLMTYFGPLFIVVDQSVAIGLMVALESTCGFLNPTLFLLFNRELRRVFGIGPVKKLSSNQSPIYAVSPMIEELAVSSSLGKENRPIPEAKSRQNECLAEQMSEVRPVHKGHPQAPGEMSWISLED
ncbi:hypothetical protein L596_016028 [Steinernema carpocapsae]|uniref:G-protein coupled receptors family 1 profile domain-containing protein n=1 Tax=Steinernema carpocapsae TaxID=34508 RepID=A0A4U5NHS6_STECR|nr:hypothetical protein L596_016028 [Steinernema carpocapsae]